MTNKSEQQGDKVGVYVCYCGGNISDHVDVEQVAQNLENRPGVSVVRTNMFMCSDPGQELIMDDIKSGRVDRVVVASCAPSLHETTFRGAIKRAGLNPYIYEHANIREQVSWVHHGDAATGKATELVSAAVAKARHLNPLEPIRVDAKNHVTVIGGGVAGLRAARDLADRGMEVLLVEKSPFLGGRAADLDKLAPTDENARDLVQTLTDDVLATPGIKVMSCAEAVKTEGYIGNFKITVRRQPPDHPEMTERLERVSAAGAALGQCVPFAGVFHGPVPNKAEETIQETGAIILATGFKPYQPKSGEYGHGDHPEVITLSEMIRTLSETPAGNTRLVINGQPVRRVGFVHCVGSRQIPGIHEEDENGQMNEYCSRVCCTATLRAACEIRERFPDTGVFDFYRDIRTYGRGHEGIYDKASANGVVFFRFEAEDAPVVERSAGGDHPLQVTVKDVLTYGEEVSVGLDLLVLASGMEAADITGLVDIMKLPLGQERFLQEVHPKLRPVELSNGGMMLAGTCQAPMDIGESCASAQAAAVKAAALLTKGYVELDPFVAEINPEKCSAHGECAGECPEKAITLSADGGKARVVPALCTGCGMCVAVCPENAIDVAGWTLKQYEAMVDAIAGLEGGVV